MNKWVINSYCAYCFLLYNSPIYYTIILLVTWLIPSYHHRYEPETYIYPNPFSLSLIYRSLSAWMIIFLDLMAPDPPFFLFLIYRPLSACTIIFPDSMAPEQFCLVQRVVWWAMLWQHITRTPNRLSLVLTWEVHNWLVDIEDWIGMLSCYTSPVFNLLKNTETYVYFVPFFQSIK